MDAPRLALTVGDPAGIGPEIVLACLQDEALLRRARLVVLGPAALAPAGLAVVHDFDEVVDDPAWLATDLEPDVKWELGRPQASAGRAALAALRRGAELASAGRVDALVTAPVSKEALHLAGERVEGQTELLGRWDGAPDVGMLAVAGRLRVLLLTRHLPLRAALAAITTDGVHAKLRQLHAGLRALGIARPRLALAGLNPHAGENGILGREEGELLEPALECARSEGLSVEGPVSPDSVFLRAANGDYDGVLALYHDQAFIPVKLHAAGRGLTLLLGLSYLRVSPAHGTAFDIAGRGCADPTNLRVALEEAAVWATRRRHAALQVRSSSST